MFTSRAFEANAMTDPRKYAVIVFCLGAMALLAASGSVHAQEDPAKYPTRAIHVVVGFTPGGGNDLIATPFLFMELAFKALLSRMRSRIAAAK